jgi:hypothetical protein
MQSYIKPCVVYLIVTEDHKYVKIGISTDMDKRLQSLQAACPLKLSVYDTIVCLHQYDAVKIEQSLHLSFRDNSVHFEWFTYCPAMESRFTELKALRGGAAPIIDSFVGEDEEACYFDE